jgi:hypothetical protein
MSVPRVARVATVLAMISVGFSACGGGNDSGPPKNVAGSGGSSEPKLGDNCQGDGGCPTGAVCRLLSDGNPFAQAICTRGCSTDTDCNDGTVCGKTTDGSMCLPPCGKGPSNVVCENGVPTECAASDGTQCDVCGCADGLRCRAGMGCQPKATIGQPCAEDEDCATENCSEHSNVCRDAVGATCTPDTCERCWATGSGWSYCSRECEVGRSCDDGLCVKNRLSDFYECKPACDGYDDPTCRGKCEATTRGEWVCNLASATLSAAKRPFGSACFFSNDCASNDCYIFYPGGGADAPQVGLCTKPCASSADCDSDASCVDVPCDDSQPECGKRCLPHCETASACAGGSCRDRQSVEATAVKVCDARLLLGSPCGSNLQCESGACCKNQCADCAPCANPNDACP